MAALLHNVTIGDIGTAPTDAVRREIDLLIEDIRRDNTLAPCGDAAGPGPYRLAISAPNAQQLDLGFTSVTGGQETVVSLSLGLLRRNLQDYTLMYESFYNAARTGDRHRLEALDAGRRGVHDEAAETLQDAMEGKLHLDKATARRLFSLVYILYKRQSAFL